MIRRGLALVGALVTILLAGCAGHGRSARSPTPPATTHRTRPGATQPSSDAVRRLRREARPIGAGPRFHPPVRAAPVGRCRSRPGTRIAVHLEVFARSRVVLLPAGIGVRGGRSVDGRIHAADCFGSVVTLDPTGVVLLRPGAATLGAIFRAWGEPLTRRRLVSFRAPPGGTVRIYVAGRRRWVSPGRLRLHEHDEVVLEVGPFVPPHARYVFAPVPRV